MNLCETNFLKMVNWWAYVLEIYTINGYNVVESGNKWVNVGRRYSTGVQS
jgi:hypothetical protein